MSRERSGPPYGEADESEPAHVNVPWADPYTDEVLAQMRAQAPLSAVWQGLKELANHAYIDGAIDTRNHSVTVYWHGPRPAAVNVVVKRALAAGITVNLLDAPYSDAQLRHSRARVLERAVALGISAVGHDPDGGGCTVHFRTAASLQAAKSALADYERRLDHTAAGHDESVHSEVAALYSPPGSPTIRISDELQDPQFAEHGVDRGGRRPPRRHSDRPATFDGAANDHVRGDR